MKYSLRPAAQSDIEFLLNLRDITMGKYLKECGLPTTYDAYLSRVLYEFAHAQIIEVDGTAIGLFKAKFDHAHNEWHLVQIQIQPSYQNNKIASTLIAQIIDKANSTNSSIQLSVLKTNPAQHLYAKLGFVQVGESEAEYFMQYKS
ncbi:GNAT family N-acetyltransferase [Pseudoalteromonas fenneropenaei]|uniref:GNAT family N-acetyltransferase n=1 Tax=Pseudoalteromonas fenneropenaei TaxID=1737459 RepID=A0ABV7CF72_9GAMM